MVFTPFVVGLATLRPRRKVLTEKSLYNTIVEHRKNCIRLKGIEYNNLQSKTIAFIPTEDLIVHFRNDYDKMRVGMLYGDSPTFDEIIAKIKDINEQISKM